MVEESKVKRSKVSLFDSSTIQLFDRRRFVSAPHSEAYTALIKARLRGSCQREPGRFMT
jgi:hypothetical protein